MTNYTFDHHRQLQGATIVRVFAVEPDPDECLGPDDLWMQYELRMPSGDTVVMVPSRDPEMNGPGWLHIETVHSVGVQS